MSFMQKYTKEKKKTIYPLSSSSFRTPLPEVPQDYPQEMWSLHSTSVLLEAWRTGGNVLWQVLSLTKWVFVFPNQWCIHMTRPYTMVSSKRLFFGALRCSWHFYAFFGIPCGNCWLKSAVFFVLCGSLYISWFINILRGRYFSCSIFVGVLHCLSV